MSAALHVPVRSCVGCGERDAQRAMLRLGRGPAGTLTVDEPRRTGRGAWLHPRAACVAGLERSKGLARSLRTTVAKDSRRAAIRELEGRLGLDGQGRQAAAQVTGGPAPARAQATRE